MRAAQFAPSTSPPAFSAPRENVIFLSHCENFRIFISSPVLPPSLSLLPRGFPALSSHPAPNEENYCTIRLNFLPAKTSVNLKLMWNLPRERKPRDPRFLQSPRALLLLPSFFFIIILERRKRRDGPKRRGCSKKRTRTGAAKNFRSIDAEPPVSK